MAIHTAEIREAQPSDFERVVKLLSHQLEEHSIALPEDSLRRATQGLIGHPDRGRIFTATVNGELIGVAVVCFLWTLEHGGLAAWLDELYIEPSHRRSGIGQRLVEAAIALASEQGCIALDLEVEADHEAAERLYRKLGFHRHRRVRWMLRIVPDAT